MVAPLSGGATAPTSHKEPVEVSPPAGQVPAKVPEPKGKTVSIAPGELGGNTPKTEKPPFGNPLIPGLDTPEVRTHPTRPKAIKESRPFTYDAGGITRGDKSSKQMALIFTGGPFADGGAHIQKVLKEKGIHAGFFFTGDFYREPARRKLITDLSADGHYLGPHSDKHLQYCDMERRNKTLVTREQFRADLKANYEEMKKLGVANEKARFFIPPYEEYNAEIVRWSREMGVTLFNYTPGTSSNADYTTRSMGDEYRSSQAIYDKILKYEKEKPHGLNGFVMLIHIGTDPERTDKFYEKLGKLVDELRGRGYSFVRIDKLLEKAQTQKP
jgi:endoglucanase